jgi:predicted nuclease of predicted toxin-antitoxin system
VSETLLIRLYLDADVHKRLAANLRQAGFDCISALEVGNDALNDQDQMMFAATEERTLLTFNIQDFVPIFEEWWENGRDHAGLIVSQQLPISEIQRRVLQMLNTVTTDEMVNNIRNLAEFSER